MVSEIEEKLQYGGVLGVINFELRWDRQVK